MNTINIPILDARLQLAASLVRSGSTVCDVGTDHGYLPIYLILSDVCPSGIATDVNKMPLDKARENAIKYGCTDKMHFYLTDGLASIDLASENVNDIVICGMGGELIARILSAAPYTRNPDIRCILQPMSSTPELRQYLADAGYHIEDELLTEVSGKIYTCMQVSYDGARRSPTPIELTLGEAHIARANAHDPLFKAYLEREIAAVSKRFHGRMEGGLDTKYDEALLLAMNQLREGIYSNDGI